MIKPWPFLSPRVEFVLSGFADKKYVFSFERVILTTTVEGGGTEEVEWAQCTRCGTHVPPEREALREHGKLHLAVDLAKS